MNEWLPDSLLHFSSPKKRQSLRLHITYAVSRSVTIKARSEVVWYDPKGTDREKGFLFFAAAGYGLLKKLKSTVRLQYFNTGGYNSRIVAYESDVLYSYSVPAFSDTGFRHYFKLQYDVFKKCSIWLRWSQTVYKKGKIIGTGLTSMDGNTLSEIKCQASYRF